jgi:hypothetical protein
MRDVSKRLEALEEAHGICPCCGHCKEVLPPPTAAEVYEDLVPYREAVCMLLSGELGLPEGGEACGT